MNGDYLHKYLMFTGCGFARELFVVPLRNYSETYSSKRSFWRNPHSDFKGYAYLDLFSYHLVMVMPAKCKYCLHFMRLDFEENLVDKWDIPQLKFLINKYGWCEMFWSLVMMERDCKDCEYFEEGP